MIVIPDIHGRSFWKEAIKQRNGNELVVFLGDYLDHYEGEIDAHTNIKITQESAYENFLEIVSFAKDSENVVLLIGNHDAEYLFSECYPCRCYEDRKEDVKRIFDDNRDLFTISHKYRYNGKDFLFTHAGITPAFLCQMHIMENDLSGKEARDVYEEYEVTEDMIIEFANRLNKMWKEKDPGLGEILGCIGSSRGGRGHGSPVWADCEELLYGTYTDFISDPQLYQVVGHSQYNPNNCWSDSPYFRITEFTACLDCRSAFRLYYFEGEAVDFLPITDVSNAKYEW